MDSRGQFTFYRSFYEAAMRLPKTRRLDLLIAIVRYGLDMVEPQDLNDAQMGQFLLVKPNLDAAWRKAKIGSLGGKNSKRGPSEKISKGKKENEKDTEKDTDTEIETESKIEAEGFRRFWALYPLKLGQLEAAQAYQAVRERHEESFILDGLKRWVDSAAWHRDGGRFVPKPVKWLTEKWFLQTPTEDVPMGASGHLGEAEMEAIARLLKEDEL